MKPSIGRVVWYYPAGCADKQPWPALIAYVHSDARINVGGYKADGTPFDARNVELRMPSEGTAKDEDHYCTWMPYQVSAAAEAAAKTAAPAPTLNPLNPSK